MRSILVASALALCIAAPTVPLTAQTASAQIQLDFGKDGKPKLRLRDNNRCDPDVDDDCEAQPPPQRRSMRMCTEDRALDKAEGMGVRRARVTDSDEDSIEVTGRDRRGNRIFITFGRQRSCPVLS